MPWNELLHRIVYGIGTRNETTADEVGDELMFHFRKLVDEKLAEGLVFDAAWEEAEKQFGPMRRYEYECRTGKLARHDKQRTLAVLVGVAVVAAAGWSGLHLHWQREQDELRSLHYEVALLRQEQSARIAQTSRNGPSRRIAGGFDLTGTIVDTNDDPVENATLLIIRKTWPEGGYRQEAFTATTNDEGRFALPEFVPAGEQYGIQVAALKDGFAFQSAYQLKDKTPIAKPDPIALRLERASQVVLVVRDGNGQPIANAGVIPSARTRPGGKDQIIYFHGSEQVQKTTDSQGCVNLNYFLTGDQATVYVHVPGDEWQSREFEVSSENQVVDLATSGAGVEKDGS